MKELFKKYIKEVVFSLSLVILSVSLFGLSFIDKSFADFGKEFFTAFLGGAVFVLWNAKRHFIGRTFKYKTWSKKSFNAVIFSTLFLFLGLIILHIEPKSKDLFRFVGIDLSDEYNYSYSLIGALFYASVMSIKRDIRKSKDDKTKAE